MMACLSQLRARIPRREASQYLPSPIEKSERASKTATAAIQQEQARAILVKTRLVSGIRLATNRLGGNE
jgi:hypothetical protein